jgi:hypothetical protein
MSGNTDFDIYKILKNNELMWDCVCSGGLLILVCLNTLNLLVLGSNPSRGTFITSSFCDLQSGGERRAYTIETLSASVGR